MAEAPGIHKPAVQSESKPAEPAKPIAGEAKPGSNADIEQNFREWLTDPAKLAVTLKGLSGILNMNINFGANATMAGSVAGNMSVGAGASAGASSAESLNEAPVAEFFENVQSVHDAALAVSVAFFPGAPVDRVIASSGRLAQCIEPDAAPAKPSNPFGESRERKLSKIAARLVKTEGDGGKLETAEFINLARAAEIRSFVWTELPHLRDGIAEWLAGEGGILDDATAQALGPAAAVAIQHSPEVALPRVIAHWLNLQTEPSRMAAGLAMLRAGQDVATRERTRGILAEWAESSEGWALTEAVARLCASPWGRHDIQNALWLLDRIGRDGGPKRFYLVTDAFSSLWCSLSLAAPLDHLALDALAATLKSWRDDRDRRFRAANAPHTLGYAIRNEILYRRYEDGRFVALAAGLPLLLRSSEELGDASRPVFDLVLAGLDDSGARDHMRIVLDVLIDEAIRLKAVDRFEDLLIALRARAPEHAQARLHHYAESWSHRKKVNLDLESKRSCPTAA